MTLPTSWRRLAVTLLIAGSLAACGGGSDDSDADDSSDDPTTTVAPDNSVADDDPTTTDTEPADSTEPDGDEGGAEAEAEAIALARRINLTIDDFAAGWSEDDTDDDGEAGIDQCFVNVDLDEVVVGRAETPTFSVENAETRSAQIVGMQTVVYSSEDAAIEVAGEVQSNQFAGCAEDYFLENLGPESEVALEVVVDDPPLTDESAGLVGAVVVPDSEGPIDGLADLHVMRTGAVVSFTITIDLGGTGAFESTLEELYTEIASRHASEID